jgi:methylmalonyl-CoA/ethylmalonyl-CoA epimerase
MNITHIEHIGIAVKNIEESKKFYENVLGLSCYAEEIVENQQVKTAFFKVGETKIELLEPTSEESPIAKFIEKRGEGIHHIAFATNNTDQALEEASNHNIKLIDKKARKGAEGLNIGFLHPKSTGGILIEFCSKNE